MSKKPSKAITKKLGDAVRDAIHKLPGGTPDAVSSDLKEGTVDELVYRIRLECAHALNNLAEYSPKAYQQGAEILRQLSRLGERVADGSVSPASADVVLQNLLWALTLLQVSGENEKKVEEFQEGLATLKAVKTVFLALLETAVSIYAPSAAVWIKALDLDGLVDSAFGAVD